MQDNSSKPRLLYYDVDISSLKSCERVQSEAEQSTYHPFFDCTRLFAGKRDLAADVREYQPDIIIFTGFVERPVAVAEVTNTDAFPEIPRIGIHTTDIFCPLWWANYQRFLSLGAHATFSNHFVPEVDWDRGMKIPCFYLPRMVSDSIFRDYGEEKLFHAGLFGHGFWRPSNLYKWRHDVMQAIGEKLTIVATGRVEVLHGEDPIFPFGEKYARMINRCLFSLSCSTSIRRPVEKCLQIPASMSCLVTEDNVLMREYGFRDMDNCVVADGGDVLEKMRNLLSNPAELQSITERGYRLVQDRYVGAQPHAFLNWLRAFHRLQPGGRVVQTGVMEFECVSGDTLPARILKADPNPAQAILPDGYKALLEDDLERAAQCFALADGCDGYCNTPLDIARALVYLRCRNYEGAYFEIRGNLIWLELMSQGKTRHDPALYATSIMTVLMMDDLATMASLLKWSEGVRHPLLQSARLMAGLRTGEVAQPFTQEELDHYLFDAVNCQSECPVVFPNAWGYLDFWRKIMESFKKTGLLRRFERVFQSVMR